MSVQRFEISDGVTTTYVLAEDYDALVARIARLKESLHSIAANTCCGTCREAALTARAALDVDSLSIARAALAKAGV